LSRHLNSRHAGTASACPFRANFGSDQRLFDQLVGAQDEARRDIDADFLCGFQIDDELEFARLFNRDIGRVIF
jgi:hypothetical protein